MKSEKIARFRELNPAQKALMLSARKEAGKFSEAHHLSKSMEVLFRAMPPSLYLAMAMTEPEEKAERFQLMQQFGIGELDAAFRVAEKIDRAGASNRWCWTRWRDENNDARSPSFRSACRPVGLLVVALIAVAWAWMQLQAPIPSPGPHG